MLWLYDSAWLQSSVQAANGPAMLSTKNMKTVSITKTAKFACAWKKSLDHMRKRPSRDLNTAVNILRLLTTKLERKRDLNPEKRERKREQSQIQPTKAGVDGNQERPKQ
jgi:hypothetical protein